MTWDDGGMQHTTKPKRKLLLVIAALALVFSSVSVVNTVTAEPAEAYTYCKGTWANTPYADYPYGYRVIIGTTQCTGINNVDHVYATCVEQLIYPWGYQGGGVWINPDGVCSGEMWDAAPSACGSYFRTVAYGQYRQITSSGYWAFGDTCG